jgi:hypothetical protein
MRGQAGETAEASGLIASRANTPLPPAQLTAATRSAIVFLIATFWGDWGAT